MARERHFWNLLTKRGLDPKSGENPNHIDSRHRDDGRKLKHPRGGKFGRGTLFPSHMDSSDISRVERLVQKEWDKKKKNRPNSILDEQYVPGGENGQPAYRITVKIKKFGLKKVGAFIRRNEVATVFPEEAAGKNRLTRKGKKTKKCRF
jgi:hypothetical protein